MPIIISISWIKRKRIEIDMPKKKDRIYAMLLVIPPYTIGTAVLYVFKAPHIIIALMFCYFSISIIAVLISQYWKISSHSMGVAVPVTALIYVFGYLGLISGLILLFVMWSRLYLKRHTISQVITGALLSFLLTALQLSLLTN